MSRRPLIAAALVAAVLLAGVLALWQPWNDASVSADPTDRALVARGQAVYAAECAACHGEQLEGQPDWRHRLPSGRLPAPPHDASGHTWHHPDQQLFDIIKHGIEAFAPPGYESDMPAFGDRLSDDQIRAVLAYIKSTWPEEIRARQEAISGQARR